MGALSPNSFFASDLEMTIPSGESKTRSASPSNKGRSKTEKSEASAMKKLASLNDWLSWCTTTLPLLLSLVSRTKSSISGMSDFNFGGNWCGNADPSFTCLHIAGYDAVNPVAFSVVLIVTFFILNVQVAQQSGGHANGQTKNADERNPSVAGKAAVGGEQVIF